MNPMAAVGGIGTAVSKRAVDLMCDEGIYLCYLKFHIDGIKSKRWLMLRILSEADSRRKLQGNSSGIERELVQEIRETTFRIDDLLDGINFHSEMRRLIRTGPWYVYPYKGTIHFFKAKLAMYTVGDKIKSLVSDIRNIESNVATYGGSALAAGVSNIEDVLCKLQEKRARTDHDFGDNVEQIVRVLLDRKKERLVISIEGLGGQGKTTLVRQVCKRIEIHTHFKSFAWISIPRKCTKTTILMEILRAVTRLSTHFELTNEEEKDDEIVERISTYLQERKYLIILDNLWSRDLWDQIREAFPNTLNGSRILLTTHELKVSEYVGPCLALKIKYLDENQCWELLHEIFSDSNLQNLKILENSGKEVMKKCAGLPLALVLLEGLLFTKIDENLWKNFPIEKERICKYMLDLNYDCLPNPSIKSCLLYISSFAEDSSVSVSKLFRFWIAEGFIQRDSGQKLEEIAKSYLNILINRGLVQIIEKIGDEIKKVNVHHVIRDWSIELARKDWFFQVIDDLAGLVLPTNDKDANRIIIQNKEISDEHLSPLYKSRTIIGLNLTMQNVKENTFKRFNLLRVLDLRRSRGLKSLIKQIGKFTRLKYLGLRDTDLEKLPSSVQNLVLLETLDVRGTFLKKLPAGIWKIRTLKHVFLRSSTLSIPTTGTTTSLLTLWLHYGGVWGDEIRDSLSRFVEKQTHLSYLKLTTNSEAKIHTDIISKHSIALGVLKLRGPIINNQLPDHTLFPQGVRELVLEFTHLKTESMATLEKLGRLMILKLGFKAFEGCSVSCSAGGFQELSYLQIHQSLISEEWTVANGALNKLKYLNITHCFDMKKLPEGLRNLKGLKEVSFQWLRPEVKFRLKERKGEDWEKIKHVHVNSIIFYDNWSKKKHLF